MIYFRYFHFYKNKWAFRFSFIK